MKRSYVRVQCDCGCSVLEFFKDIWDDGEVNYNVCVLDSRYDHNVNSLFGRLRRAAGVLFGKPVYFNDVLLMPDEFDKLLEDLRELRDCRDAR